MIIPLGKQQVTHVFGGTSLPRGAAVTFGADVLGGQTPDESAEFFHDTFGDLVMPQLQSGVTLLETRAKYGPQATGPFGLFTDPRAGGQAGDSAPPNVAYLVEKRTALGGRSGRGRMYLPGVNEGRVNDNGTIVSASRTAIQTAIDAWFTALDNGGVAMYILHNASSDATIVTSLDVDPVAATQRRRLR
jgi:hypothetical protein